MSLEPKRSVGGFASHDYYDNNSPQYYSGKIINENDGDIYSKMEVYPASTRPPQ
jgi:hypothetical protein